MTQLSNLFIGKPTITFDELDSSNEFASQYLSKNNPSEGTVIKALFQREGKGQIGRQWFSSFGLNSLCSVILFPDFLKPADQFFLNMCVANALRSTIEEFSSIYPRIKWPNDIYIRKEKVAGILVQNSLSTSRIQSSIIGTGINVNQDTFPEDMPNPTSLFLQEKRKFRVDEVEQKYFFFLEKQYLLLKSGERSSIKSAFVDQLFGLNSVLSFQDKDETFSGIIRGIDERGRLCIEKENSLISYNFREIRFLL